VPTSAFSDSQAGLWEEGKLLLEERLAKIVPY
jgi:hypothetical protein